MRPEPQYEQVTCPDCEGTGCNYLDAYSADICINCEGTGAIARPGIPTLDLRCAYSTIDFSKSLVIDSRSPF